MASQHMRSSKRQGSIVVLVAIFMVPLLAIVAFAVDYGHLMKVRCDLQRYADLAVLAGVQELIPNDAGVQDLNAARVATRLYVNENLGAGFIVLDADIEIGRYDPATVYSNLTLLNTGIQDTLRITLRRDATANSAVSLFFANVLGMSNSDLEVTATAALQKGRFLMPGAEVLPFAVPKNDWDAVAQGDTWSIYGDGTLEDAVGNQIPGNWGTLDIGSANNSTSDLGNQIVNGLEQGDLDALNTDGRIPSSTYIDSMNETWMQADTGISVGMRSSVEAVHGKNRIIPLYGGTAGSQGNNLEFQVTGWAVVKVVGSTWQGAHDTSVTVQKSYIYDGDLRPNPDLSSLDNIIAGAYTSPALLE